MPECEFRPIPTVRLADGTDVPALGLGTWRMGESRRRHARELTALLAGIDAGFRLFDTAEMYGDGGAEELLAQAIAGRRDEMFLVSKVYPQNAGAKSAIAACERSLRRLATDRLDMYLLHWRGRIPLDETIGAFERLRRDGKILRWGVSNLDAEDMLELLALEEGRRCAVNQVLYHLGERGIEWALADLCRKHDVALMAYSPFGEGGLLQNRQLARIARSVRAPPSQLALAWLLQKDRVIAIPQSSDRTHVVENRHATSLRLSAGTLAKLDTAFPPPSRARPLVVI